MKFQQNKDEKAKLLSTIGFRLVYRHDTDNVLGELAGKGGENLMGKLLMEIRDEFNKQ